MKGRFAIFVDRATKQQQDTITNYFKHERSVGYWHWFNDVWLITDVSKEFTTQMLRDKVQELAPGLTTLVMQIDNAKGWSGFGSDDKFNWIRETWSNGD